MHDVRPGLPPVLQAYRRLVARRVLILAGLLVLCMAAFLLDLVTGPSSLTPLQVLAGVFSPDALSAPQQAIIWQVRLPYALMAVLVGAALSLAGVASARIHYEFFGPADELLAA